MDKKRIKEDFSAKFPFRGLFPFQLNPAGDGIGVEKLSPDVEKTPRDLLSELVFSTKTPTLAAGLTPETEKTDEVKVEEEDQNSEIPCREKKDVVEANKLVQSSVVMDINKLTKSSVDINKLPLSSVDTNKLPLSSVDTNKLPLSSVDTNKLPLSSAVPRVTGRDGVKVLGIKGTSAGLQLLHRAPRLGLSRLHRKLANLHQISGGQKEE